MWKFLGVLFCVYASVGLSASVAKAEEPKANGPIKDLQDRLERLEKINRDRKLFITGLIEVELSNTNNVSDIAVATAQLGFAAQVSDTVSGYVILLYEEGGTFEGGVDEAIIELKSAPDSPFSFIVGRTVVPFGDFSTALISDSLPLELAETSESIMQVQIDAGGGLSSTLYLFNGDADTPDTEGKIDGMGARINFAIEQDSGDVEFGIDYINNIADSDTITDLINNNAGENNLSNKVAGIGWHAGYESGSLSLTGEYIKAIFQFSGGEIDSTSKPRVPMAWHLEAAWEFSMDANTSTVVFGIGGTNDLNYFGLPKRRYAIGLSTVINKNTVVVAEWKLENNYSVAQGGTGEDAKTLTCSLQWKFE